MSVDNVKANTSAGVGGTQYTTSLSGNDNLTNEDFIKLMITELKMQDPTSPMDSQRMMDTQMQMSTIETNLKMTESMKALQSSIANMTLSNAIGFMGKKVDAVVDVPVKGEDGFPKKDKDGNTITEKVKASFRIGTVKVEDGVTYLESNELIGFRDRAIDKETEKIISYDYTTGQIKNEDGTLSPNYIKLDENGRFVRDSLGNIIITDKDGTVQKIEYTPKDSTEKVAKYSFLTTDEIYSPNNTNLKYEEIVKIY